MKVADLHCDTIAEIYGKIQNGAEASIMRNDLHLDLEKMKQGDYLIQNFALYTDIGVEKQPLEHTLKLLDVFYDQLERYSDLIGIVRSYGDIQKNMHQSKMSAMLTIEEGACCKGEPAFLRNFYRLGVRMMTLTWNYPNELAYPNHCTIREDKSVLWEADQVHGLTERGIYFLEEMERLGMILDVSHLSDAGILDVYRYTKKPFVASHSNTRTVAAHPRNLTDEMIRMIAERGGVAGINYCSAFLRNWKDGETMQSTVADMVRHIAYFKKVGGIGCIGLGSDFDGITSALEMSSAAGLPLLEQELRKTGFSQEEIEAVFFKNVLRVYREVLK